MMKRLSLFMIGLFLCYIIYYDLQIGTLPAFSMTNAIKKTAVNTQSEEKNEQPSIQFYEVKIKQGDTVLSITERYHGSLPASIETIVKDFESLNSKVKAEAILLGETYRFPIYKE